MNKIEKILEKMESSPSSISFADAKDVFKWMGYTAIYPKRGWHVTFEKNGVNPIIVVHRSPIKEYSVQEILKRGIQLMETGYNDVSYYMDLKYDYALHYNQEDQIYVIKIPELKGCMSHGESPREAIEMIEEAKESWFEAALRSGMEIPEPSGKEYSEKFVVRVPKSVYKPLAKRAKEEGMSLDQLLLSDLSEKM